MFDVYVYVLCMYDGFNTTVEFIAGASIHSTDMYNWTGNAALTGCGWLKPAKWRHYVTDVL